ncbi:heterokaryon incompatibility protein-domain-containing protein [Alternaria rosae]|uniref:heterokaryon incompatibility protein-domain-containing protein n=1 Tax=Alternaria rosae TaxID=1187941 RepID=UPI001E8DC889|nr:heterokaryon incompatibility protein-domain-containing protein [Alternaria rosae]KAH6865560.1 heterokaryon incompatibility protein-domain-containing protein [Alternaria rosae]
MFSMANDLCDECQRISIDTLRSSSGFAHSSLLHNIDCGISSECALCSEIEKALPQHIARERLDDKVRYERPDVRFYVHPDQIGDLFVTVGCRPQDIRWLAGRSLVSKSKGGLVRSFRVFADRGTAVENVCRYSNPLPEPFSDKAFNLIKLWLHRCLGSHEHCRTASTNKLPSRVIDVGPADGSQNPFLHVSSECSTYDKLSDVSQRYIALSYCWGSHLWAGKDAQVTTASSLEARRRGIRITDLPQTIHDAVVITRRLGVRYLWVDALCILQGSDALAKADWERESSKMADVYGGAFLTIAAASARSVHEGIFHDRKPQGKQVVMQFSAGNNGSLEGPIYIQHNPVFRDCIDEPLYHRGWTIQERILSPRVVVFTRDQLVWNCQTQNLTESGIEMNAVGQLRLRTPDILEDGGALQFWHSVVRDYSSRHLTNATDKLPAISGLAAALCQQTGDRYLAGLWENSIFDDLLWANASLYSSRGNRVAPSRLPGYRAPSWSWASVHGNIDFHRSSKDPASYCAKFLWCHVTHSGIDKLGAVSGGWIKLRGPLVRVLRYGLERGSNLIVQTGTGQDAMSVCLGQAILDAGKKDIEISTPASNDEFSDIWVLRIKTKAGLVLRVAHGEDCADATDDDESLSTTDDSHVSVAADSGGKRDKQLLGSDIVQRLRNIWERLPWKKPKTVIMPPVHEVIRPRKGPIPKRFRRIGMIELEDIGMQGFKHCEKRTVTIV